MLTGNDEAVAEDDQAEKVRDLKATMRKLRSSKNNQHIEEQLKSILDDMGLIQHDEIDSEKREIDEDLKHEDEELTDEEKVVEKRDDSCSKPNSADSNSDLGNNLLGIEENKDEPLSHSSSVNKREEEEERSEEEEQSETKSSRKKRQKSNEEDTKENSQLVEGLKDSGELMVSGNKSPLASSSEIVERDVNEDENEENVDEKRVVRQIQSKINSLKEEVKREIAALKEAQTDDEKRKKRQTADNLADEETEDLNPVLHPDGELKPLNRKRRSTETTLDNIEGASKDLSVRKKRDSTYTIQKRKSEPPELQSAQKTNANHEDSEEGGELLGDDNEEGLMKRDVSNEEYYLDLDREEPYYDRNKRSRLLNDADDGDDEKYSSNNYFYDIGANERLKRQDMEDMPGFLSDDRSVRYRSGQSLPIRARFRRRISDGQLMDSRPQQLSDMSDLELFGALPQGYDGELSRYKRVKRD